MHPIAALRAVYGVNLKGLATLSRGGIAPWVISRLERSNVEPTLFEIAALCPAEVDPEKLRQAIITFQHNQRGEVAAFGAWLKDKEVDLDAIDGPAVPNPEPSRRERRRALFASVAGGARG